MTVLRFLPVTFLVRGKASMDGALHPARRPPLSLLPGHPAASIGEDIVLHANG
jgi:hypothetical protein